MNRYCLVCHNKMQISKRVPFMPKTCSDKCNTEWYQGVHFIYTDWKMPMGRKLNYTEHYAIFNYGRKPTQRSWIQ